MRNVFSLCVQNVPGVLSHVAGMLAARGYNVDSLTVCAAENPALSNMTIVLDVDPRVADQVGSQLQKLVTAVETHNLSRVPHIERELALIRVEVAPSERTVSAPIADGSASPDVDRRAVRRSCARCRTKWRFSVFSYRM